MLVPAGDRASAGVSPSRTDAASVSTPFAARELGGSAESFDGGGSDEGSPVVANRVVVAVDAGAVSTKLAGAAATAFIASFMSTSAALCCVFGLLNASGFPELQAVSASNAPAPNTIGPTRWIDLFVLTPKIRTGGPPWKLSPDNPLRPSRVPSVITLRIAEHVGDQRSMR